MTQRHHVRVRSVSLDEGAPVALRDSRTEFHLMIDFSAKPEDVAAALEAILQECVDSDRWRRVPPAEREAGPPSEPDRN